MSEFLHPVVARLMLDSSQYTHGLTKASAKMEETATKSEASVSRMGKAISGANMLMAGAIGMGIGESLKVAGDFQQKMMLVRTQAHDTTDSITTLGQSVMDMAPQVSQLPTDLAEGLYHVTSVGYRGAQAMDVLKVAAQGATVSGANLDDTTYSLASMMNTLNIKASGATGVMAQLNAIVGAGDMRFQDLNRAIGTGFFATAKTFGVSTQSAGAALAFMTDRGAHADEAATRLRMTIALLAAPSDKAAKMLNAIGLQGPAVKAATSEMTKALQKAHLTTNVLADDLRKPDGLFVALKDLQQHLVKSGLSADAANALLSHAFGGGKSDATILAMLNSLGTLQQKYKAVGEGTKRWSADVQDSSTTFNNQMKSMTAAAQGMGIQLGNAIMPIATKLLTMLTPLFEKFGPHMVAAALGVFALKKAFDVTVGTVHVVSKVAGGLSKFFGPGGGFDTVRLGFMYAGDAAKKFGGKVLDLSGKVLDNVGKMANSVADFAGKWIGKLADMVKSGAEWLAKSIAQGAIWVAKQIWAGVTAAASAVVSAATTAAAWVAANAAMILATGGIILAIGLLVAAGIWLYKNWDKVTGWIKNAWKVVYTWIDQHAHWIITSVQLIWAGMKLYWTLIWDVIQVYWNLIKLYVSTAIRVVKDIIGAVMDIIHGRWGAAWAKIKDAFAAVWGFMRATVGAALRKVWDAIWGVVSGWYGMMYNIGANIIKGIVNGVKSIASNVGGAVKGVANTILSTLHIPFQFGSPSKVTTQMGRWIGEGLANGIMASSVNTATAMRKNVDGIKSTLQNGVLSLSAGSTAAIGVNGLGASAQQRHRDHLRRDESDDDNVTWKLVVQIGDRELQNVLIKSAQRYKNRNGNTGLT